VRRAQPAIIMKNFVTATATALLILTGGCGERARFQPTENVTAVSPSGQPAASYELRADESDDSKITVNVWSEGAKRDDDRTVVDLSIEVRNTGTELVELDRNALSLEVFNARGTPLPAGRLDRIQAEKGTLAVGPGTASTTQLRFDLPVPVPPSEVGALRLRWGVVRPDGERYVQFTEFRRQPERVAVASHVHHDPIFGFYDPFFYGPPYGYHFNYYVPVRRVIVVPRRPVR
jgi:hypothetical protein